MTLWFYDGAFAQPDAAIPFEDEDEDWHDALAPSEVRVLGTQTEKNYSHAVCGAEFAPGATSKSQSSDNLLAVHALVLDVDDWSKREPFTEEELREYLAGYRFIAWTTWSSRADHLKWRVVIPLASPMPPTKHKALWRILNEVLDGTMVEQSVSDPARLGFFGSVASETGKAAYRYFIADGERLDWTLLDLEDSELSLPKALTPADLTKGPDWSSETEAFAAAKRYYGKVGTDVEVGGRHEMLLRASCRLWWDFALEDEKHVYEVLAIINNNFAEPKDDEEVWKEVQAGYERTLGENRVDQPTMYGYEREPVARATKTGILEHAKGLKRQSREDAKVRGRALEAIARGHAYAEPVEAKALTFAAAAELAAQYPREQPERLLDIMQMSLQAQRAKGTQHPVPTDGEVLSKIRWKQNEIRRRVDDRDKDRQDAQRRDIATALGGARDTPYTSRELKEWEQRGHADNRWILQREREFFFFVGGEYQGPYGREAATNFAHVKLAPASERVRTHFTDEKGKIKARPFDDLVREYGSLIDKYEFSYAVDTSTFYVDERKLVMPALKMRDLEPEFSPEVDQWLQLLAGARYADLELWLAAFGTFDRELSALLLVTEPNQGKKLLADGIARLYSTVGCISLEDAINNPTTMLSNPLCLIDERVPFFWRNDATPRLREWLSKGSRQAGERGRNVPLAGFPRVIISANTPGIIWDNVDATPTEEEATRQRLLTIDTRGNREAGDYLESLGARHRQFVTRDLIAKHVLYLQSKLSLPAERFVVHDEEARMDQQALRQVQLRQRFTKNTTVDEVGFWFYRVLVDCKLPGNALFFTSDNRMLLSPQELTKVWEQHAEDKRPLTAKKLRYLLDAFCSPTSERVRIAQKGQTRRPRMREFSLLAYEAWLQERGLDPEDVIDGINEIATRRRLRADQMEANDAPSSDEEQEQA